MKRAIIEVIIALTVIAGTLWGVNEHFAKASDLRQVEVRLDQKIISDSIQQLYHRMWQLEDRNGGLDCSLWKNQKDKDEYRRLQLQLEELKKRHDLLIKIGEK